MGSLTPHHVQSIAVPIFHNKTLYREFEFSLTEAVIKEILTGTNLRVASLERADSVLKGSIVQVAQSTVTKDESRLATQFDVSITVEVVWEDLRTGEVLLPLQNVSETIEVYAERGESFETAVLLALGKLARAIVYTMESPALLQNPGL